MISGEKARVLVSGYYGCRNTGDEAVLAGIVAAFGHHAQRCPVRFTVLSADTQDTHRRHGLDAAPRMDMRAVRAEARRCDLLLSGGGSLLQDATSLRSLVYYLAVIAIARRHGRPVMAYAQGMGPLRRRVARWAVCRALQGVACITVRDPASADLLASIGVTTPVEVTADPAFALPEADRDAGRRALRDAGLGAGRRVVGVAARPLGDGPGVGDLVNLVRTLGSRLNCDVALVPLQPPGDVDLAAEVARGAGASVAVVGDAGDVESVRAAVSALDGLVGMRLHSLIFACAAGVPSVALSYDPKVSAMADDVCGTGGVFPAKDYACDGVAAALDARMAAGDDVRQRCAALAGRSAAQAVRNAELAVEVLGR